MASGLVASLLAAGCCSSALAGSSDMSLANYLAAKQQLSTQHRAARAACDADGSQPREICLTEAMGNDWIAKADLEVAYRSTPRSRFEASAARVDARFWLARERCGEVVQANRLGCLEEAKALQLAARAEGAAQRKVEELDDACAREVIAGEQLRSPACVLRAADVRKQRRRSAP